MNTRRWLRIAGFAVSMLAVAWIVVRFVRSDAIDLLRGLPIAPAMLVAVLIAGSIAYAAAMCLPAIAWWRVLTALSPRAPPAWATMSTYAVTQFGKYLPGNVAHYALRHALSRRHDVPHASLAFASIIEAALLVLGALIVVVVAGAAPTSWLRVVDPRLATVGVAVVLAALWAALYWTRRRELLMRLQVRPPAPSAMLASLACYTGFFLCCAALIIGLAHTLDFSAPSAAILVAASAASWLAGFVVIGAPAGLGVREATFVALTGAMLGESRALLLISLFRIVTFLGDTLFLAVGAAVSRGDVRPNLPARP